MIRKLKTLFYRFYHSPLNIRKRAQKGSIWISSSTILINIINFVVVIVLARYFLGPKEFGIVNFIIIISEIIKIFTLQGITDTIIYMKDDVDESINTLFYSTIFLGFVFFLILFLCAPIISAFFNNDMTIYIRIASVNFIISAIAAVPLTILRKELLLNYESVTFISANIVWGFVAICLAFMNFSIYSLLVAMISKNLILMCMGLYFSKFRPKWRYSFLLLKKHFKYIKYVTGESIIMHFLSRADHFIISKSFHIDIYGFYSQAFNFINYPLMMVRKTFHVVLFSLFSKMQEDKERLKKEFLSVSNYISILFVPFFLGIGILAEEIIQLTLGDKWHESVPFLQVFSIFALVKIVGVLLPQIVKSMGYPKYLYYYNLIRLVVIVPVLILVRNEGAYWIVISLVILLWLFKPVEIIMLKKILDVSVKEYIGTFYHALISSIIMCVVIKLMSNMIEGVPLLLEFLLLVICAIILYFSICYLISPMKVKKFYNFIKSYLDTFMSDEGRNDEKNEGTTVN